MLFEFLELMLLALLAAYLLAVPVLALVNFIRGRRAQDDLRALRRNLADLRAEVEALKLGAAPETPAPGAEEAAAEPGAPARDAPFVEPEPEAAPAPEEMAAPPPPPPTAPPPVGERWEERLASRWMVWLGGVALALAAAFLVKYTIERGLLGPAVRVGLGVAFGVVLVAAGEFLRRRPSVPRLAAIKPSQVPPALTAAGLAAAFASLYAAYGLYGFLAPPVAFVLLALVAAAAFALSLLQGPFVAVLGLLGGYLVPLLVATPEGTTLALCSYLIVVVAAALAVLRYMAWAWLGWLTLLGALAWPTVVLVFRWRTGDALVVESYLILVAVLFLFVLGAQGPAARGPSWLPKGLAQLAYTELPSWLAAAGAAVLAVGAAWNDRFAPDAVAPAAVMCAIYLASGRRLPRFDGLAVLAGALAVTLLLCWRLPVTVPSGADVLTVEQYRYVFSTGPVVPAALKAFVAAALGLAALHGIGAFIALWGARRPGLWAAVSGGAPVLLLAAAYLRIEGLAGNIAWTGVALALAAALLVGAQRTARHRATPGYEAALAGYAVAVSAAMALAGTMALDEAWLTVALSVELAAIAWVHGYTRVATLRRVALVLAAVVLARLALNPEVLSYALGPIPGLGWVLYGYGVPLVAFYLAARRFRRDADDYLVVVLEGGALTFGVLLVSLEIRDLIAGSLDARHYSLLEESLQAIAWLAIAYGLYRRPAKDRRLVQLWGWRLLAGLAAGHVFLLQVLWHNPLRTGEAVGDWPLLNTLSLAYLAPALLAILFLRVAAARGAVYLPWIAGVAALVLVFVDLSLEVRRAFHGSVLTLGGTTDAEWYSYSAAWLVYAGLLLGLGLWRRLAALRYASLALVMLSVAKVFLFDMAALTGLYRVASFLGLGLALVAVGYLYQRFLLSGPAAAGPPE